MSFGRASLVEAEVRLLSSVLLVDSVSVEATGLEDWGRVLGSRLAVSVSASASASGVRETKLAASEGGSSMDGSMGPREVDREARGAPVARKGETAEWPAMLLLARRWPRSSRLDLRNSGKRLTRVERRLAGAAAGEEAAVLAAGSGDEADGVAGEDEGSGDDAGASRRGGGPWAGRRTQAATGALAWAVRGRKGAVVVGICPGFEGGSAGW